MLLRVDHFSVAGGCCGGSPCPRGPDQSILQATRDVHDVALLSHKSHMTRMMRRNCRLVAGLAVANMPSATAAVAAAAAGTTAAAVPAAGVAGVAGAAAAAGAGVGAAVAPVAAATAATDWAVADVHPPPPNPLSYSHTPDGCISAHTRFCMYFRHANFHMSAIFICITNAHTLLSKLDLS